MSTSVKRKQITMPVTVWQSWMSPLKTAIAKAEAGIFCAIDEAALTRSLNQLADTQKDSSALRVVLLAEMKAQLAEARSRLAARLHVMAPIMWGRMPMRWMFLSAVRLILLASISLPENRVLG